MKKCILTNTGAKLRYCVRAHKRFTLFFAIEISFFDINQSSVPATRKRLPQGIYGGYTKCRRSPSAHRPDAPAGLRQHIRTACTLLTALNEKANRRMLSGA